MIDSLYQDCFISLEESDLFTFRQVAKLAFYPIFFLAYVRTLVVNPPKGSSQSTIMTIHRGAIKNICQLIIMLYRYICGKNLTTMHDECDPQSNV